MRKFIVRIVSFFFLGVILFVPLPFLGVPFQMEITTVLFAKPVSLLQQYFFGYPLMFAFFSSDTIALNLLLALLLFSSAVLVLALKVLKVKTEMANRVARLSIVYYLIFILLKYGFDKIFLQQFYVPGPNILYSEFGKLSKDILYWSTMGLSPTFSIATGIIEVSVAVVLTFRRTRTIGLLLAILVLVNVVLVNFAFDISVKTFSCLLLAGAIFSLSPNLKAITAFFLHKKQSGLNHENISLIKNPHLKAGVKVFVLGIFLLQVSYPYVFYNKGWQTDGALTGAYQVVQVVKDGDTLVKDDFPIKRIFFSKSVYLVFEANDGTMTDYFVRNHVAEKQLEVFDYDFRNSKMTYDYDERDSVFKLEFDDKNHFIVKAKALDWKTLPALQDDFHLTIDEIK